MIPARCVKQRWKEWIEQRHSVDGKVEILNIVARVLPVRSRIHNVHKESYFMSLYQS